MKPVSVKSNTVAQSAVLEDKSILDGGVVWLHVINRPKGKWQNKYVFKKGGVTWKN